MTRLADLPAHLRPMARAALDGAGPAPMGANAPRGPQTGSQTARRAIRAPRPTLPADEAAALGVLVFVLPLPESVNRSGRSGGSGRSRHWRAIHADRCRFVDECDALLADDALPPPPRLPLATARLDCALTVGALNDDDNAHARTKWGRDWLVSRGYLLSDRSMLGGRPCLVRGTLTQTVTRKRSPSLTLTLTPTEAPCPTR